MIWLRRFVVLAIVLMAIDIPIALLAAPFNGFWDTLRSVTFYSLGIWAMRDALRYIDRQWL